MQTHVAVGFYVVGFLYFLMLGVCCVRLFALFKYGNPVEHSVSRWFHMLIAGVALLRCIFVVLEPEKIGESDFGDDSSSDAPTDDWDFIAGTFPAFLFFSTFLLLIVFWADLYYRFYNGEQMSEFRLGPLLRSINVTVYTILIVFYCLKYFDAVSDEVAIKCLYSYVFVVCCVCTLAFWFYGARLYLTFSQAPMRLSDRRSAILRTVGTVTSISLVCMITRSIIVLTMAISEDLRSVWAGWLFVCYLLFTEMIPLSLILYVLRKIPASNSTSSGGATVAHVSPVGGGGKIGGGGTTAAAVGSVNQGLLKSSGSDDSVEQGRNARFGPSGTKYGKYKIPGMAGGVDNIIANASATLSNQAYVEIQDPADQQSWEDNEDRKSVGYYG